MALDEATTALLQQLAAAGFPPLHTMDPEQARALVAQLGDREAGGPEMVRATDEVAPAEDPEHADVPIRVLVPVDEPDGVIVWLHGGGWVIGSAAESEVLGRQMAAATGCAVLLVDYRLAPEHRYPAAVEDAWTALRWADRHRAGIAGRPVPLVVGGDSAGGNLAAACVRRAVEAGGPGIAFQVLVYPVASADTESTSYLDPDNQLLLSRDSMIWFWDHYLPDTDRRAEPDASPMNGDLHGQPPALVLTAEHDPLRDEGEAFARALGDAGVEVEHHRLDGQMHGFFTMVGALPGAAVGMELVTASVRRRLDALDPETVAGTG